MPKHGPDSKKRDPSRARRSPDSVPLPDPVLPFWHGHPLSAVTTGFLRNPFHQQGHSFIQGRRIQPGRGPVAGLGLGLVSQWACMIISPSPGRPQTSPENQLLGC